MGIWVWRLRRHQPSGVVVNIAKRDMFGNFGVKFVNQIRLHKSEAIGDQQCHSTLALESLRELAAKTV